MENFNTQRRGVEDAEVAEKGKMRDRSAGDVQRPADASLLALARRTLPVRFKFFLRDLCVLRASALGVVPANYTRR